MLHIQIYKTVHLEWQSRWAALASDEDIVECFDFEQMNQVVVAGWGHFEGLRVFQVSKMC